MRFSILSFVALAVTAGASAVQPAPLPLNPPLLRKVDWSAGQPASIEPATNAKRLAQGLPPKNPVKRRPHRGGPHRDGSYHRGGSRVASAPRAQTSPSPRVQQSCNILVTETNGTPLGFLSRVWNDYGEYGMLVQTQDAEALLASFSYSPDIPAQLELTATNGLDQRFPLVGGVLGFSSSGDGMGPGQINYAYLAGTTSTPPGPSTASDSAYSMASGLDSQVESAIWSYDPVTQDITAQWINDDGSGPATYIGLTNGVAILTGDPSATGEGLGVEMSTVNFKCVPAQVIPL